MYTTLLEDVITHILTGMPSGETQWSPAIMQQLQQEFQARKKDTAELDIEAQNVM